MSGSDQTTLIDNSGAKVDGGQASSPANVELADPSVSHVKATKAKPKDVKQKRKKLFGGINLETSEYVIDSMSMLIQSGVSVGEALDSIAAELPKKSTRDALYKMRTKIDDGVTFSKALAETGLFGSSIVTLIEVGEISGRLPENLKVVAGQLHKNNVMNSKIKSAMLYPAFLLGLLFVVGLGIGIFLLPRLLTIINSLQVKVGPFTEALILVGTLFGKYGVVGTLLMAVVIIGVGIAIKVNDNVRAFAEEVVYKIPGIKKLLFEMEVARFGFILGTLLDAGLPITLAIQSTAGSMSTRRYRSFALALYDKVEEGSTFSGLLAEPRYKKLLSGTVCQIIKSAEKSGNLTASLLKVGSIYEDKADITARNLETMLEPIVLIIIAIGVLFIAMAVFLPIYSLIGNFNSQTGSK